MKSWGKEDARSVCWLKGRYYLVFERTRSEGVEAQGVASQWQNQGNGLRD